MDIDYLIWLVDPTIGYGPNGTGNPRDPELTLAQALGRLEARGGPGLPTVEQLEAAQILADKQAAAKEALAYRQARAKDYIKELSPEGTFETSVGDLFNAILKHIYEIDPAPLAALATKINAIKARYPKG